MSNAPKDIHEFFEKFNLPMQWLDEADSEITTASEFLLSLAGIYDSKKKNTSEDVRKIVEEQILKKESKTMHSYYYRSRPPSIGCQPPNYASIESYATRQPAMTPLGTRQFWGIVRACVCLSISSSPLDD